MEEKLIQRDPLDPPKSKTRWWLVAFGIGILVCAAIVLPVYFLQDDSSSSALGVCAVMCEGPILAAVQNAQIFNDSKTFVDMPLIYDPQTIIDNFNALPNQSFSVLQDFVYNNFLPAGSDCNVTWEPPDWTATPAILNNIINPIYQQWASDVNQIWLQLGLQVSQDVYDNPQRHTLMALKHPYMVVPGGRFREFYYWDTYWILRGLLICEMNTTANMVLENLLQLVDQNGFMPNGNREYYLTRSQPPFLTLMVSLVYNTLQNMTILTDALPILEKEYNFWMNGKHAVTVVDVNGTAHKVNRYYSDTGMPRPESYFEDEETAEGFGSAAPQLYNDIAAAAESGWDFSSRWFANGMDINTTITTQIIPVDLNAILCGVESTLSTLFALVGNTQKSSTYSQAFEARKQALTALLWNSTENKWTDYNWNTRQSSMDQTISSYIPLWTQCFDSSQVNANDVVNSLLASNLILPGGLVTTLAETTQQWDYPNAWPPLQWLIIEALDGVGTSISQELAFNISSNWLNSGWLAWNQTGVMFEKYLATIPGQTGSGGEYDPQTGFGWTNGVFFSLLQRYPNLAPL